MSISNKIAVKISKNLDLDKEKTEVITYGLFAFLQIITALTLVSIFGLVFNVFFQALIVSFVSSILRQYSGGAHASRPSICLVIGTIATIFIATISKYISVYINDIAIIFIGLVITLVSYYIIYKKAPVDSKSKPIEKISKRNRMRKNSILVLSIYLLTLIILLSCYILTSHKIFIQYIVCIYLAFGWQVFSLTIIGHNVLTKLDSLISKLYFNKGGNGNEKI